MIDSHSFSRARVADVDATLVNRRDRFAAAMAALASAKVSHDVATAAFDFHSDRARSEPSSRRNSFTNADDSK